MLTYFVFDEFLAAAQKITTTNDIFCISLEWLDNALFVKEFAVGLVLDVFSNTFSQPSHGCLSVRSFRTLEPLHHRLYRFH